MRILGVDLGEARTGLAVSDPHEVTCTPVGVVHERDGDTLAERILDVAREVGAGSIVVGLPRPLSGGTNAQRERVEGFVALLAQRTPLAVATWDERFTSKLAERGRGAGSPPADAVAACHMLQSYIDARANEAARRRSAR